MVKKDTSDIAKAKAITSVTVDDMIRKSKYALTLQQQRVVLYLISQIEANDEDRDRYQFNLPAFCRACEIEPTVHYTELKETMKSIQSKSIWYTLPDGKETAISWIDKFYIDAKKQTIEICLDADMKAYFRQLRTKFNAFELVWILHFKSKYTNRLYGLLDGSQCRGEVSYKKTFSLQALKLLMDAENYTIYQDFKARVLMPAIEEINHHTNKFVTYEPKKTSRSYTHIEFTVTEKETVLSLNQAAKPKMMAMPYRDETGKVCGN